MKTRKGCEFEDESGKCDRLAFGSKVYCVVHYREIYNEEPQEEEKGQVSKDLISQIPPAVTSLQQLKDVMGVSIPALLWGQIDPQVMKALTSACIAQAKLIEMSELEEKLQALEGIMSTDIRFSGPLGS